MSKLYTEEQVKQMIDIAEFNKHLTHDEILKEFSPIKLPTDGEVYKYIKSFPYTKHLDDGQYNDGVIVGAELAIEWMRDKIKGGNNE